MAILLLTSKCVLLNMHCSVYIYNRYDMPVEFDGLKLDRPSTLKYFSDLRYAGIRAHIWP